MIHCAAAGTGTGTCGSIATMLMTPQTPAENELAHLIVTSLNLPDLQAGDIDPQAALFGGDLGLDSIDILELALAITRRYGFQLRSDNPDNRRIFSSLRELSAHVERQRTK
jgi:acyl carrier protein